MKAKFACPGCGQKITVTEAVMGKRGKCPGCGETIAIPTLERFQAAAAAREPTPSLPANDPLWDDGGLDDPAGNDLRGDDPFAAAVDAAAAAPALAKPKASKPKKPKSSKPRPQRPKTWRAFGGMVLGVALMLAAVPVSFAAFFVASQMMASRGWPSVEGRVLASHVRHVGFGKKQKYQADVRFDYQVNGRFYTGSRVRLGDTTGSSETAQQAIVDKYPIGSAVSVFYDPDSPQQSVLEPGGWPILMAIPPVLLAGIGWVVFGASTGRIKT